MSIINFFLRYKWFFIFGVFMIALFLFFQYFMLHDIKDSFIKDSSVFDTKVGFSMKSDSIKKVVLDNGMTILVFKNTSTPKVLLQIAYDVGSFVEQEDEKGLAHLIEHMIFKGTEKLSESDIDAISRKYGATLNAFTGNDLTSYYFETDKNNWQPFLFILSDCMQNARFDSQHLASELKAVIQELRMQKDDHLKTMIEKAFELLFPPNHPYHFPIIGYKEDLLNLSAENLKKFYNQHYGPERATLFVVGNVDVDEVIKIAKENFENIKGASKAKSEKEYFPKTFQDTVTCNTSIYEDVKKEQLGFYWKISGLKEKDDVLVSVIEFILGQGEGSRFYRRLVDEEKVATSLIVASEQLMDGGILFILVEPVEGKSEQCKKLIEEELEKLIKDGVDSIELNKVIRTRSREFFQRLQSLQNFTLEWILSYFSTKNELEIFEKVNRFSQITSSQIQQFVSKYLDPFFMNQISILPLPESKKDIWQKSKEESEKFDLEILKRHQRTVPVEQPKYLNNFSEPKKLDFSYPKPNKTFMLDNGLEVILCKNGQWPILSVSCRFKQANFFSETKEGVLLDLMMNCLIEGSFDYSKKENVDFFENSGSAYSFNVMGGMLSLLNKGYKDVLQRFIYVLKNPTFAEEAIEKLKNIFSDSYERRKDSQFDVGLRLLKNSIYKDSLYSWTFDEAISLIKNIQAKDLKDFHKKYLTPKNMILTIVGDFDIEQMQKDVKDIFDNWEGKEYKAEISIKDSFLPKEKIDKFMLRDQIYLLFGQPSIIDIYHPDLIPVKILNFIVFYSLGSRLSKLRERTGLFYHAFGVFAADATRVHGFDYAGAILSLDKLDQAEKSILEIIDKVGKDGVDSVELDVARNLYLKALIDITSSNEVISSAISRLKSFELGFDYYDKVLDRVQTIDLEELNKAARKYFITDDMTRIRVGRIGKK